ncbi:MAG TPA: tetratricopeptide repeat protein, partial [Kiloniellaceae bacterium]|nr:tetratricopeptide repeat protein [Kiloniellaceae bacterium]
SAYAYGHLAFIAEPEEARGLVEQAQASIDRAVVEAPDDLRQYAGKRAIAFAQGDAERAVAAAERAYELAPNDSYTRATLGHALTCAGRADEALALITMALRDMPSPPGWMAMSNVLCHFVLGEYAKAMEIGRETLARQPDFYPVPPLIAALAAELNMPEEMAAMRDLTLRADPQFGAKIFVKWVGLTKPEHRDRLMVSLKAARLPG